MLVTLVSVLGGLYKATNILVVDASVFRDPTYKQLEAVSRTLFSLAGPALHPVLAVTCFAKSIRRNLITTVIDPLVIKHLKHYVALGTDTII